MNTAPEAHKVNILLSVDIFYFVSVECFSAECLGTQISVKHQISMSSAILTSKSFSSGSHIINQKDLIKNFIFVVTYEITQ
jgi:hypothetical protein